jgi:hypothetical protein
VNYYCRMEARLTDPEIKILLLEEGQKYFYTINPVQITNVLGNSVTLLLEYSITDVNGKNHKLYKTKEGNWYDIPEANFAVDNIVLMSLKSAINSQEIKE